MAKLERAGAGSNLKRLRRERAVKQQVQQQALMLEVQTLSMMLTDLRRPAGIAKLPAPTQQPT
jgi:hypothetical protein